MIFLSIQEKMHTTWPQAISLIFIARVFLFQTIQRSWDL